MNNKEINFTFASSFKEVSNDELKKIQGGRNKLAYTIGHYEGKAAIAGLAVGAFVVTCVALWWYEKES